MNSQRSIYQRQLNEAFGLLGKLLETREAGHFSIIVCGGSALIALGLISRATRDVDVIALFENGTLISATSLPDALVESGRIVAQALSLPPNWLNPGPASIFDNTLPNQGFPVGFKGRLKRFVFSSALSVFFVDRYDQIHFKLYAAADQGGPGRHFTDLIELRPTDEELKAAVKWAILHDPSDGFMAAIRSLLGAMERHNVLSAI